MPANKNRAAQSNILRLPIQGGTPDADVAATGHSTGTPGENTGRVREFPGLRSNGTADRREWMADEMQRALVEGRFVLHYQPQFEMGSTRIVGVEALVRMTAADGALVQPDEFIPIAEDNGFIVDLGHWVLRESCRQLALWRAEGFDRLRMAVNVSPRQLSDRHLIDVIDATVAEFGLDYSDLELEITEQCVFAHLPLARSILHELHDRGLRIALDDFGTGYSSFAYLAELPVHILKMDRTFLTRVTENPRTRQVVSAMIAMARELDLDIVAEGVETAEQYRYLQSTGCHICQGFGLAHPAPAAEIRQHLATTALRAASGELC